MLVLSRKVGERIILVIPPNYEGGEVLLELSAINLKKKSAKIAIDAPRTIRIHREEQIRDTRREVAIKALSSSTASTL